MHFTKWEKDPKVIYGMIPFIYSEKEATRWADTTSVMARGWGGMRLATEGRHKSVCMFDETLGSYLQQEIHNSVNLLEKNCAPSQKVTFSVCKLKTNTLKKIWNKWLWQQQRQWWKWDLFEYASFYKFEFQAK